MTVSRSLFAAAAIVCMAAPSFAADTHLAAAVAAHARSPENSARDGARHPIASLEFWGLKPGMTVIEISPGGGYWSEILAPYAKATGGHYIAATGKADARLPAKFSDAAVYGPIHYTVFSKTSGALAARRMTRARPSGLRQSSGDRFTPRSSNQSMSSTPGATSSWP